MKKQKQLQLILSAIFMALASLTTYGQSVGERFDVDGIKYEITSTSPAQVEIVDYDTNSGTEVTIPPTVTDQGTDYQVTAIGKQAFFNKQLTKLTFSGQSNVTNIEEEAFWGENDLKNQLESVTIPNSVESIGKKAFMDNQLTSVVIGENVTIIGAQAFMNNQFTSVTIPENVTHIRHGAFWNAGLTQMTVEALDPPAIGQYSFLNPRLIDLVVPPNKIQAYKDADYWKDFGFITSRVFTIDGIKYGIIPTSLAEVKVVDYTSTATAVNIPQTVNDQGTDYKVTVIGIRAFSQKGLTEVTFTSPSNVTSMEEGAFDQNKLTSIVIPESITRIEKWVFAQNDLEELLIPATVESIGFQAFYRNGNLTQVRAERNPPTTVDPTAFQNSGPNGNINLVVGSFGAIQAYRDAGWTRNIGINTVTIGTTVVDGVRYGITTAQPEATLMDIVSLPRARWTIPEMVDINGSPYPVTAIADSAFRSTRNLQEVIIPSTSKIKSIGFEAFYRTPDFHRIRVELDDPPTLDADAFEYPQRHERIDLVVPEGKEQVYRDAGWIGFKSISSLVGREHFAPPFLWEVTSISPNEVKLLRYGGSPGEVEIPSEVTYHSYLEDNVYSVTSIGDSAFNTAYFPVGGLTKVIIPDGVRSIRNCAFCENSLTEVDIPDGVTTIADSAFWKNNLTSIEIPESVTSLGSHSFANNQLTRVTTPINVKTIERWAFKSNPLTEVTISSNVEVIDLFAFEDNPNLRLVTVEANDPPVLHNNAFANADRDQIDLVVPQVLNVDKIAEYLANGWNGFRSISYGIFTVDGIRYGITSLDEVILVDYTGTATAVSIPETVDHGTNTYTVTAIREDAFQNKELTNIEIPSSVTSIGQRAFSDNQLTAVTLPGSVESIGGHAFYNNPGLALVTVGAINPPALDATAFANANRFQIDLLVPMGKRQDYLDNGWNGFRSVKEGIGVSIEAPAETVNLSPFTVTFQFDLEVTGFTIDDINLGSNATANHFMGSGSIYTVEVTPTSCNGVITIDVPANTADMPNFTNLQAKATVTVEEDPNYLAAIARDITVQLDADGRATILPEDLDNGSAYGCGNTPELSLDIETFDCSNVGTPVTVTLTADHGTESATTTATVTVEEYLGNLTANAKDIIVQLDADGQASISPGQIDDGSVYGCGNTPELSLDRDAFTCDDVGTPVTVTLTANQGTESATATATVTVEEYLGNLVAIARDITVQLGADGQATISPQDVDNGSAFGCDGSTPELSLDIATFDCSNVGTPITVTLTANQGTESTTATATVTVEGTGSCPPMIPTAFTPNGDGANDLWTIDNLSDGASVKVYDRNGAIIFSSDNGYTHPWDGTFRGKSLPSGGYIYRIQDGPNQYRGTVTILL